MLPESEIRKRSLWSKPQQERHLTGLYLPISPATMLMPNARIAVL